MSPVQPDTHHPDFMRKKTERRETRRVLEKGDQNGSEREEG